MDFDIPAEIAAYLRELDEFIEREIRPLERENDNIRFFDHRREHARTDWDNDGQPRHEWEELLAKARRDGEAIVHQAQEERVRLLSREEVVKSAQAESERLLEEAREMARQIRLEAEDYVDAKLAQFEIVLERTLGELQKSIGQVRRGRDKLRGVSVAEEEFGTAEPEEQQ